MCRLNKDEKQRDLIIFGNYDTKYYPGGVRYFKNLSLDKLEQLIDGNFISLSERQNNAPSVKEIYEFMKQYPGYTAHGYTVSVMRDDYRVSLEGVFKDCGASSMQEFDEFTELFNCADDFLTGTIMYCWFD